MYIYIYYHNILQKNKFSVCGLYAQCLKLAASFRIPPTHERLMEISVFHLSIFAISG